MGLFVLNKSKHFWLYYLSIINVFAFFSCSSFTIFFLEEMEEEEEDFLMK